MERALLTGAALALLTLTGASAADVVQNPDWLKKPSPEDLNAVIPSKAVDLNVSGKAVIRCEVNLRGLLEDCAVDSESPPGFGFGQAALMLAPAFQMKPAMVGGKPVRAGVRIPINFDIAGMGPGNTGVPIKMVRDPAWAAAPTRAEFEAAWPRKAGASVNSAQVAVRCHFKADGTLRSCDVVSELPQYSGFGDAAIKLAESRFKAVVGPGQEAVAEKLWVTIPMHFERPGTAGPPVVDHPTWIRSLNPAVVEDFYPAAAKAAGVRTGLGLVECVVADDGNLADCTVISETPVGLGFGEAALKVAGLMQMNPWSQDGGPVGGARIRLPLRLTLPEAPAAEPPKN